MARQISPLVGFIMFFLGGPLFVDFANCSAWLLPMTEAR
jgi:hypothetical protein